MPTERRVTSKQNNPTNVGLSKKGGSNEKKFPIVIIQSVG